MEEEEKEEEKEQEEEEKEQEKVEEGKAHEMLILAVRGALRAQGWQGSSASSPGCPEHIPWELPRLHQHEPPVLPGVVLFSARI